MAQMAEGSPQIFVKKDWLSLQDQNNGNYGSSQLVIDTSQLANSNKYMDYRNAYLSVPLVMAETSPSDATGLSCLTDTATGTFVDGATQYLSLKNWFGSIIHSMLLDYAGTTIIQQTPLCSLWQVFGLVTSLSMADVETLGPSIGFYPDDANFSIRGAASTTGVGTCNNVKQCFQGELAGIVGSSEVENKGIWSRWSKLMIDSAGNPGQGGLSYDASVQSDQSIKEMYRSCVHTVVDPSLVAASNAGIVYQIQASIYLRHIHSFFSQIPLLKGVFFRLTLNLNQPVLKITVGAAGQQSIAADGDIQSPLGGIVPIMVASQDATLVSSSAAAAVPYQEGIKNATPGEVRVSLNVGNKIIDAVQAGRLTGFTNTNLNASVFLYVPSYTFNPSFESAYLSKPTKTIVYSDLYQYTTTTVASGGAFNFLITNGISNVKSVLIIPMEAKMGAASGYAALNSAQPWFSPFDSCGGGSTAPMAALNNFNVVVAGQNMIYNTQQYSFEQFQNHLYGVNAVNSGLTDGLTSGLVDYWKFQQMYSYYYVNCARMMPADEAVPKSVSIQGTNKSAYTMKFVVFIEYGVQVNVDVLTGARV
jgi:hypothetical protein